jgi:hypothetical protein
MTSGLQRRDVGLCDSGYELYMLRDGKLSGRPHGICAQVKYPRPLATPLGPGIPGYQEKLRFRQCAGPPAILAAVITGLAMLIFGAGVCAPVAIIGGILLVGGILGAIATRPRHHHD